MTVPIPEFVRRAIALVRADMCDAEIERLAGADSRLRTTLLGHRERLRDPLVARLGAASDRLHEAHTAWKDAIAHGSEGEVEMASFLLGRARDRLHHVLDELDRRALGEAEILQYPSGAPRDLESH